MVEKFDKPDVLKRGRKDVNFIEADVMIAKGEFLPSEEISFADYSAFQTWLANFESTGVNAKDSPEFSSEDITEEFDYEDEVNGVKCAGKTTLKKINGGVIDFVENDLRNVVSTLLIIPKDRVGTMMLVTGIKLSCKTIGKGNSETSSSVELAWNRRAKYSSDVYRYVDIPPISMPAG